MLRLSKHFMRRWEERVGSCPPGCADVIRMIEGSVILQKYEELFTVRGFRKRIPALYWYPQQDIVFKVDESLRCVMTVLSPEAVRERMARLGKKGEAYVG